MVLDRADESSSAYLGFRIHDAVRDACRRRDPARCRNGQGSTPYSVESRVDPHGDSARLLHGDHFFRLGARACMGSVAEGSKDHIHDLRGNDVHLWQGSYPRTFAGGRGEHWLLWLQGRNQQYAELRPAAISHENKKFPPRSFLQLASPSPHLSCASRQGCSRCSLRRRAAASQQHTDDWFVRLVDTAGIYPRDRVTISAPPAVERSNWTRIRRTDRKHYYRRRFRTAARHRFCARSWRFAAGSCGTCRRSIRRAVPKIPHPEPIRPKPPTQSGGPDGPIQTEAGSLTLGTDSDRAQLRRRRRGPRWIQSFQ